MKQSYIDLKNTPLDKCGRAIAPVSRGHLANEYGDAIQDYSTEKSPLTNRLIKPYITSETHGPNVFDYLVNSVNIDVPYGSNILDLGCGAGEFLSKLSHPKHNLYGVSIHLGEVKYAREIYGLENVCPIDMREIAKYFDKGFFSCIIAHCCLHFISPEERTFLINETVYSLLDNFGLLYIIDYKGDLTTGVNGVSDNYLDISPQKATTMGNLSVYRK